MKRLIMYISFFVIVMIGTYGILILITSSGDDEARNGQKPEDVIESEEREFTPIITEETFKAFEEENLNPFGETKTLAELESKNYANYIHGMVHQKVSAEEKWIFFEMHDERIDWLLKGLKGSSVPNTDMYTEILEKWQKGDFSEAVEDHNVIWRMQGGNIGKAERLLNAIEEEAFVEKMYREKDH